MSRTRTAERPGKTTRAADGPAPSFDAMVAALVDADLSLKELDTPAEVRAEVNTQVAFWGITTLARRAENIRRSRNLDHDPRVMRCRRAVANMLVAEGAHRAFRSAW
ncbi:hypothetical protein [Parafrankia sp. FMc2]|uniref:hypothetical protein n=1 Tax=Parafrankia sp. FMc2 TaxID=3233196 RepID=UPI0034D49BCB